MPYNQQPKSMLEKISEQIERVCEAEDELSTLLGSAGRDSETEYTKEHRNLLLYLECFLRDLQAFLSNHTETIMDLESAIAAAPKQFNPHNMADIAKAAGL